MHSKHFKSAINALPLLFTPFKSAEHCARRVKCCFIFDPLPITFPRCEIFSQEKNIFTIYEYHYRFYDTDFLYTMFYWTK